jgi:hypothetical protein
MIIAHSLLIVAALGVGLLAYNGAIMVSALLPAAGLTWTVVAARSRPTGVARRIATLGNLGFFGFVAAASLAAMVYLAVAFSDVAQAQGAAEGQHPYAGLAILVFGFLMVAMGFLAIAAVVGVVGAAREARRLRRHSVSDTLRAG